MGGKEATGSQPPSGLLYGPQEAVEMTLYRVNIYAVEGNVYGQLRGAECERLMAALSADPETIEELELALTRYGRRPAGRGWLGDWQPGLAPGPNGFGVMHLDLVARVLAVDAQAFTPRHTGAIRWHDGRRKTDVKLPYRIDANWHLTNDLSRFPLVQAERRQQGRHNLRRDDREILFGKCPEYVATAVLAAADQLRVWDPKDRQAFIRDVHAKWLLTPRADLDHRAPRDVMLDERHDHLCQDLMHQQQCWSLLEMAPPGISRQSAAYRFAGFGTHEIVIYYEMMRELLDACVTRACEELISPADWHAEVQRLEKRMQDWLHFPQDEMLMGRTPAAVIDRERRRLPEAVSGEEAMVDCDCPLCQAMAEDNFGTMFWGLDGSGMDPDFAFSFFRTREEWEAEQMLLGSPDWNADLPLPTDWQPSSDAADNSSTAFPLRGAQHAPAESLRGLQASLPKGSQLDNCFADPQRIWQKSMLNLQLLADLPPGQALEILLFAVGANVAELIEDLRQYPADVESLRQGFKQLRQALKQADGWRIAEATEQLSRTIDTIVESCPELQAKGGDFKFRLGLIRNVRQGPRPIAETPQR